MGSVLLQFTLMGVNLYVAKNNKKAVETQHLVTL